MTKLQKLLVGMSALLLIGMLGCAAFQNAITPCWIEEDCRLYADANVPRLMPYTTIADADYVDKKMDYVHDMGRKNYLFLKGVLGDSRMDAEQFKAFAFNPQGPIGLLTASLPMFGLGALLVSKPSDKKEIDRLKNGGK